MAKFCRHCGSPLEEGQVCACQSTQAAPEAPVATAEAPAAAPAAGNALVNSLKAALLGYWKSPKAAAAAVAEDKSSLAMAGIFAGVNFLMIFFYMWRMLGQITSMVGDLMESIMGGLAGLMGGGMEDAIEFEYPILPLLVSGIVIAAVGIALSALVIFVAAKINKQEADIKNLLVIQSVHTIAPSALLLVGLILGFITWELQVLVLALILVLWFINICNDVRETAGVQAMDSGKTLAIQTAIVFVALAIVVFAISKLTGWCFEELAVDGVSVGEALEGMSSLGGMMGGLLG